MPLIDRRGQRYGRLRVQKQGPSYEKSRESQWWCKCDCGNQLLVRASSLSTGNTRSCGCLFIEAYTTHGEYYSPENEVWSSMIQRCTNPNNQAYENYGGRGIRVCARWQGPKGFQNFLADMGKRPSDQHQLDRRNNHQGYTKSNCRWVLPVKNSNNTRTNVRLTLKGRTQTQAEWARELNMPWSTIGTRLRNGWSVEDALMTPTRFKRS